MRHYTYIHRSLCYYLLLCVLLYSSTPIRARERAHDACAYAHARAYVRARLRVHTHPYAHTRNACACASWDHHHRCGGVVSGAVCLCEPLVGAPWCLSPPDHYEAARRPLVAFLVPGRDSSRWSLSPRHVPRSPAPGGAGSLGLGLTRVRPLPLLSLARVS